MLKLENLKRKHVKHTTWPREKRIQAVSQYLVLGNMNLVAASTGIPYGLLRQWKMAPWWAEYEKEIRSTENLGMDSKMTKIVDRALDQVADQLENGTPFYNKNTGEIDRLPVNIRDAKQVAVDILTKRELLRGNATDRTEVTKVSTDEHLKALALEFAKWAKGKKTDAIDVESRDITEDEDDAFHEEWEEGLQEGSGVVYVETGSGQEEDGTECSPSGDGKGGESPQG